VSGSGKDGGSPLTCVSSPCTFAWRVVLPLYWPLSPQPPQPAVTYRRFSEGSLARRHEQSSWQLSIITSTSGPVDAARCAQRPRPLTATSRRARPRWRRLPRVGGGNSYVRSAQRNHGFNANLDWPNDYLATARIKAGRKTAAESAAVATPRQFDCVCYRGRLRPTAPGMRCRTGFPTLQHFHQRDK
jgi:hypothetical protein